MNFNIKSKFFSYLEKIEAEKKILLLICTVMATAIIILAYSCLKLTSANKTIILPPVVNQEFWSVGDTMSSTYYEQVGFYIADRIMSVSPSLAESSYDALLPFFSNDPKELASIRKTLQEQADFIKKENLYQTFYPIKVITEAETLRVEGMLRKYVGEMYIHEIDAALLIKYVVSGGRFKIKSIEVQS